ncbi:MAG TPA: lysophospholipid acyltransferase family protein [Chitinophagaceae bacterium]
MRFILKPLQWLYCIYSIVLFVAIMLLLFPFVVVSSFFGKIKGGNAIFKICRIWADLWFTLVFIFPKRIFEFPHDKSKPYIFVTNHISLLDAALLPKAYRQPLRPLGKIELSRVPVFGFIYRKAIVTVDRSSSVNRARSIRILKSIVNKGISVLFFPEGTYNETDLPLKNFYNGAFRVAIETQTPVKPVLFLDAHARLHYQNIFSLNPGRCRIVFLNEVAVEGLKISDTEDLKWKVYEIMERKLRQYKSGTYRELV